VEEKKEKKGHLLLNFEENMITRPEKVKQCLGACERGGVESSLGGRVVGRKKKCEKGLPKRTGGRKRIN